MHRALAKVLICALFGTCLLVMATVQSSQSGGYVPPEDGLTHIVIDGDGSDWAPYPVSSLDEKGDSTSKIDLISVTAFVNDTYLYILLKTSGSSWQKSWFEIYVNLPHPDSWPPDYVITIDPARGRLPEVVAFTDEGPTAVQVQADDALADDVEVRIPLTAFAGNPIVSLAAVLIYGGGEADTAYGVSVLQTDETDPLLAAIPGGPAEEASVAFSELCTCQGEKEWFQPAQRISVPSGYRAEYVVAPSGLNVPSDVAINRDGEIFVTSSRARSIFRVGLDGSIRRFASSHAYAIDVDAAGRLYGYNYPAGEVLAFDGAGREEVIAQLRESACESTLAAAPDGTLYIALNYCMGDEMGDATLYRLRPEGRTPETILDGVQSISALDVSDDGIVYAIVDVDGWQLSIVDIEARRLLPLTALSFEASFHGLAVARDGSVYISSGVIDPEGAIYRYAPDSDELIEIASVQGNGIQGIEILQDGTLVGVQRAIGGLQRIHLDGTTSAIVEPNGLVSPQAITATPCGELVIVNDEAGWASIVCPDGTVKPFVRMVSYIAPMTYVASSGEGWIVAGESAPGFPSQLVRYSPSGDRAVLATDILDVSGVAVASDGSIYASETREDRILMLSPSGDRSVVTADVRKPQALALSPDGRLFAIVNRNTVDEIEASMPGDAIVEVLPSGAVRLIAEVAECYDLALAADGSIYVASGETIWRVTESGSRSVFASGFQGARGAALLDGDLYVTDDVANAIIRITKVEDSSTTDSQEIQRGKLDIP